MNQTIPTVCEGGKILVNESIVKDFLQQFYAGEDQIKLPGFLEEYYILSCIYEKTDKSCYLATDRKTYEKYLLKINKKHSGSDILKTEHQRLCQLSDAFPEEYKPSVYHKEEGTEYLLKHYIQGTDLETYQEQNRQLSIQEILRIVIPICENVEKLHSLKPPVLHRDIKPENLIIDNRGVPHLIDFETARDYCENKSRDTVLFGTDGNAAPEQYGYSQTDVRTDVFGIGKVLEFLYRENSTTVKKNAKAWRQLKKITTTATAFDPAHRYQSVSLLKRELNKVYHRVDEMSILKKVYIIGVAEAIIAVLLICTVIYTGGISHQDGGAAGKDPARISDATRSPETDNSQITAEESRRESDGEKQELSENEPAQQESSDGQTSFHTGDMNDIAKSITGKKKPTQEDYEQITRIAVVGNQIYKAETNLEDLVDAPGFEQDLVNGEITDISVLSKMTNLREVYLCDQRITDISPLEGLPIESLYLSGNQITDFSVIESLKQLKVLFIVDNPVSILPDLSKIKQFVRINMGGNIYNDLDFLKKSTLGSIDISNIHVKNGDFSVLHQMTNLTDLRTAENQPQLYQEIPKLKHLTHLALWGYGKNDLSIIKSFPQLEDLCVSGNAVKSLAGIEAAANLRVLRIDGSAVTDISELEQLKALADIKIAECNISDYTPLFKCNNLTRVIADEEQKKAIERIDPDHTFQVTNE